VTVPLVWVVGRGGFLGGMLERLAPQEIPGAAPWQPPQPRFAWDEPARLTHELGEAARAFGTAVRPRGGAPASWMVLWCASGGGVGTTPEALARETDALRHLLGSLGAGLGADPESRATGVVLLSSSAGAVYGDTGELPLTERSPCRPISAYGRAKLDQEALTLEWAAATPGVSCLVARLSNLYGPGQSLERSTGLIARLSQSLVHRRPLHVYVPLDTLRDYLHGADAARYVLRCLDRLRRAEPPVSLVKVVAREQSISIAGLIGIFARVAKRAPRIICAPSPVSRQQPSRVRFRSEVWTDCAPRMQDLAAGIRQILQDHMARHQAGQLPVPANP
jgi:UDP-glucose 4-epimerase